MRKMVLSRQEEADAVTEQEIYTHFIDWMRNTWVDLPDSEHLLPMIQANYTLKRPNS